MPGVEAQVGMGVKDLGTRNPAKKLANLKASVALHYAHYNFVHRTPRCTPVMAAGVTNRLWSVEELIRVATAQGETA